MEAAFLERQKLSRHASRPLRRDPDVRAAGEKGAGAVQVTYRRLSVSAVDGDEPGRGQRVAEDGDAEELLLGDHPDVRSEDVEEDRDVVKRLVIAHHEVGRAGRGVLAPHEVELYLSVLDDVVGPAIETVVADLASDASAERLQHRGERDGERLVDVADRQGERGAHRRIPPNTNGGARHRQKARPGRVFPEVYRTPSPTLAIARSRP